MNKGAPTWHSWLKHLTLGFVWGRDLRVMALSPRLSPCSLKTLPEILFPSLSAPPTPCSHVHSLSK